MFGFFQKPRLKPSHFKNRKKRDQKRYERERALAESDDENKRLTLARNSKTHQEILYYLAENDPSSYVRQAVAENASAPIHVSTLLADDNNVDVRMALAGRLVHLLPHLTHEKHSQLYAYVVQALGTLALDEVLKIRKALSSALKDDEYIPPKIAAKLSRDIERDVSEPILRFCAALSDDDLMDIISEHRKGWQIEVIASRDYVSEPLSMAVIETGNRPAGKALIKNEGAELTPVLLEYIVDRARDFPEWREPVATHKKLSPKMAGVLAEFVDDRVRNVLMDRSDINKKTSEEISRIVRDRIYTHDYDFEGDPMEVIHRLVNEGNLNEETLRHALGMRKYDLVIIGIAHLANIKVRDVRKIFELQSAKSVCALCWLAGLSMRTAFMLQQQIGHISAKKLLYPKGGEDYPMNEDEIKFQLDFLGLYQENKKR